MPSQTIGVDLASKWFQIAIADPEYRIQQRRRLSRECFEETLAQQPPSLMVMEACASAHYWARVLRKHGHAVKILPAQYVCAYVRRNKTDAADAAALIEASRCEDIQPVPIKSIEQQVLQQLHRLRMQWRSGRMARMNAMRGMLREFGVEIARGPSRCLLDIQAAIARKDNGLPDALRPFVAEVLGEIREFERQIKITDRTLRKLTCTDAVVQRLQQIPGVGLMTSTALRASVAEIERFASGRHFASWLGITTSERSTGNSRRLGKMSRRGDTYLRMLLIQGSRSVMLSAARAEKKGEELDQLSHWALQTQRRIGRNKAAVALGNKLARIIWALWRYGREFDGNWMANADAMKSFSSLVVRVRT